MVFNHTLRVTAGPDMERNPETAPPRSPPAPDGVSSDSEPRAPEGMMISELDTP